MGFGFRFRVQGSGFSVQGSGFRVEGLGFRVSGFEFLVAQELYVIREPFSGLVAVQGNLELKKRPQGTARLRRSS